MRNIHNLSLTPNYMHKIFLTLLALLALAAPPANLAQEKSATTSKTAIFAGGCFWCMQEPFDHATGVVKTVVGYTGGDKADANYSEVSNHRTQHREAIEVTYDPAVTSYEKMLEVFFHNINPTQADGQFHDIGLSYQAAIYFGNEGEQKAAQAAKDALGKSGKFDQPIVTEILPTKPFYPAEDYHQKYYLKNPAEYEAYHVGSGRVAYLKRIWGDEEKK
ncbi:MAG TPA: peptide-methionine (S)-S-oxide reductase MsrA [Chthoniobacterales bacterium]|nr:peptide-methionine (S)-S-oxide reductase MsrA [Chthoniobacterales bacterium]